MSAPAGSIVDASAALRAMPPRFHLQTDAARPGALTWSELLVPETLRNHIDAHGAGRSIDDRQVAASMFVQGLAMHVVGTALAAEFVHGAVLRPDNDAVWVVPGHPTVVWGVDPVRGGDGSVPGDDQVADWVEHWLVGRFGRLIDAVRATTKVGRRMLEGNVASGTLSNFVFLDWWERTDAMRNLADRFAAHPFLARHASLGEIEVQGRTGLRSERNSCCLLLRVDGAHACPSCPMVDADQRHATTSMHVGHLLAIRPLQPTP